jgi:hypothetical protein
MGTAELARWLFIECRSPGHNRGNRVRISTHVHRSFTKLDHRQASAERPGIFGRAIFGIGIS